MKILLYLGLLLFPFYSFGNSTYQSVAAGDSLLADTARRTKNEYLQLAELASKENPRAAVDFYRKAIRATSVRDTLEEASTRLKMGKLLLNLNDKEALAQASRAEVFYRKKGHLSDAATALELQAKFYEKNKLWEATLKKYNDLYKLHIENGEALLAGNTASHVCDLLITQKKYQEAFDYVDKAKNAYDLVCRRDSMGAVYLKAAYIKKMLKKPRLAEFYVVYKALPHFSASDSFQGRIKSFNFLARMYRDQKRFSQAKWFYLQAKTQSASIHDTVSTITSLLNLSVLKTITGDLDMARHDLAEAEQLGRSGPYSYLTDSYRARYKTLFRKLDAETIAATSTVL